MKERLLTAVCLAAVCVMLAGLAAAPDTRPFTDAAGRLVQVPVKVERVFAAGPPAAILLYTLAPEKLLGWTRSVSPAERAFLAPPFQHLPVLGRLTGRADTANVEVVLAAHADLILDVGAVTPTYASLADRVQQQTGIPVVLLDGRFDRSADLLRTAGALVGVKDRGDDLAGDATRLLADLRSRIDAIPEHQRPRVYYARGPSGLETGLDGSINTEMLSFLGARNVAAQAGSGGLTQVSLEQIVGWDPDVILTVDARFAEQAAASPAWRGLRAVRDGRLYVSPALPFGWFDVPPSVNRLLGARWAATLLYPRAFPGDLRPVTRAFFSRFYHVELDDRQLDLLLGSHGSGR